VNHDQPSPFVGPPRPAPFKVSCVSVGVGLGFVLKGSSRIAGCSPSPRRCARPPSLAPRPGDGRERPCRTRAVGPPGPLAGNRERSARSRAVEFLRRFLTCRRDAGELNMSRSVVTPTMGRMLQGGPGRWCGGGMVAIRPGETRVRRVSNTIATEGRAVGTPPRRRRTPSSNGRGVVEQRGPSKKRTCSISTVPGSGFALAPALARGRVHEAARAGVKVRFRF